jgi:hypothetical protein
METPEKMFVVISIGNGVISCHRVTTTPRIDEINIDEIRRPANTLRQFFPSFRMLCATAAAEEAELAAATARCARVALGRRGSPSGCRDSVFVVSAARVGFSQSAKHRHYSICRKFAAMRARIADKRSNKLQRRRLLRRTRAHNPMPVFIGKHREVLHRLHISPTGERFPRAWDVDVPPGAFSAALEALTIACQLIRVFDCGRTPCKGDGRDQTNQQDARVSHRKLALSRIRGCPAFSSQS